MPSRSASTSSSPWKLLLVTLLECCWCCYSIIITNSKGFYAYTPPPLIDKVPTYRLYQRQECAVQIPGRGEVNECRNRLHDAIITFAPKGGSLSIEVQPLQDIASQAAFEELLLASAKEEIALLIEFYGKSCKQCALLGPMYASLPYAYRDRRISFFRADVTHFPQLVIPPPDPSQFYDLDRSANIAERLEGCPRCGGSGFVSCPLCEGKGHIAKTVNGYTVADICMSCVGHKKIPCTQCGGKCYLC